MKPTQLRSILALTLSGACLSPVLGSSNGQDVLASLQPAPIRLDVNLVQLPVTVTDSNGHLIPGLPLAAFRLFVDGKQQPITVFGKEDAPVTAGLVVDN